MNLLDQRRTEQGERATEGAEIGRSFGIEAREAAIQQVAAQLSF